MFGETRTYQMVNLNPNDRIRFDQCAHLLVDRSGPATQSLSRFARRFVVCWRVWKPRPDVVDLRAVDGRCDYLIPRDEVRARYKSFLAGGYSPGQLHFSAQCPEEDKLLQGEIAKLDHGLSLFASISVLPMRQALSTAGFHLQGLQAHMLLKRCLCPNSWEWLQHLFDEYPGHVYEFTTIRYPWGVIPNHNTVWWEVRNY